MLDFYIGATESSEMWKETLYNLKERGVEQYHSLNKKKDIQQFTEDLKSVYKGDSLEKAKIALDDHLFVLNAILK